jgi:hypothetical protein
MEPAWAPTGDPQWALVWVRPGVFLERRRDPQDLVGRCRRRPVPAPVAPPGLFASDGLAIKLYAMVDLGFGWVLPVFLGELPGIYGPTVASWMGLGVIPYTADLTFLTHTWFPGSQVEPAKMQK